MKLRPMTDLTRRRLIYGSAAALAALGLSGCISLDSNPQADASVPQPPQPPPSAPEPLGSVSAARYAEIYGPVEGDRFPIPAVKLAMIKPAFRRITVNYETKEVPGTIVVDPAHHYLYYVLEDGEAVRYGVGVGREGFAWAGEAVIKTKQEWPDWYPPREMLDRQPELTKQMSQLQSGLGMPGGPKNPLGARAMYLWQDDKDTLFRIHGTIEPGSIGKSVSSGCIRMINQDVIDLYNHTPVGAKVVVLGKARTPDVG
jgi:lipoprotein-anchoring transpeptidase ErfK/SrfK